MKPFDEKFAENVREVFDAWQGPVDEQAWQQMKARLGKKSQPALFVLWPLPGWSMAAAAAVLLLASVTFWQVYRVSDVEIQMVAEESAGQVIEDENNLQMADITREDPPQATVIHDDMTDETVTESSLLTASFKNDQKVLPADSSPPASAIFEEILVNETTASKMAVDKENAVLADANDTSAVELAEVTDTIPNQLANVIIESASPIIPLRDDVKIIEENLYYLNGNQTSKLDNPGIEFSAGSVKTYSMVEMADGMGYSAGVSGHWPLSKRLSMGGGGIFVYNQFSLNNPDMAYWSSSRKYDYDSSHEGAFYGDDTRIIDRNKRTDVEFMAIDIPVNFRYRLTDMSRGEIYVSAGISSLLYLQQSYFSQSEILAERTVTTGIDTNTSRSNFTETTSGGYDAFNRFDLGRFLNLSLGYVIKRERHSLLIEPYIKYPLGNVTSLDLQIYMAGVSLKYQLAKP
jgi:hypothetical protein